MRSQVLCSLLAIFVATAAFAQPLFRVRIETDRSSHRFEMLESEGFEPQLTPDGVELIVSESDLENLRDQGMDPVILERSRPFADILRDRAPGNLEDGNYLRFAEIIARMEAIAAAHPDICRVVDLTVELGAPVTHEGRHIMAMRISDNVNIDEDEPASLIVSNHHAREVVTPVIALYAIEQLANGYGTNPAITKLVDENDIWIVPTWNPDGYEYVFTTANLWRKNRRDNGNGTFGVDLNRNYPFGWGMCGGSTSTGSNTYSGPSAASEPETQTMLLFAQARGFARVADLHSSGREVRYGYGCWNHPWMSLMASEAATLSVASAYGGRTRRSCCLGGNFGYHTAASGAYSFLWETATAFQPPYSSAILEAEMVWPGLQTLLEKPAPLSGHVYSTGGTPLEAEITFTLVNFAHGEHHGSNASFGRYHAFPPQGNYTIEFSAVGYKPQTHAVSIGAAPVVLNVVLESVCYADCDQSTGAGVLDLIDFICFGNSFVKGEPYACDCDTSTGPGVCDLLDFICFQSAFVSGCP